MVQKLDLGGAIKFKQYNFWNNFSTITENLTIRIYFILSDFSVQFFSLFCHITKYLNLLKENVLNLNKEM